MWIKESFHEKGSCDYILFKSIDFGNIIGTFKSPLKFALFDLDGTLITSKNGHNPKMLHTNKDPNN